MSNTCSIYNSFEGMCLVEAVKEAIWLNGFLGDLGIEQVHHVVFCDSQSTIHLAKDEKVS